MSAPNPNYNPWAQPHIVGGSGKPPKKKPMKRAGQGSSPTKPKSQKPITNG
jgi:hypothetical protein